MKGISAENRKRIKEGIRQRYTQVAINPEGNFRYPTGKAGLNGQNYHPGILKKLPDDVLASYCGVGNPFSLGPINEGEVVLDVGCGAGVDTLIAAIMVGPKARVVGIDLIPEMLERARENLGKTPLGNVIFQEGSAEDLLFPDESFDVVISNGVFNLTFHKERALEEAFRVLRPGGRFMIADMVLVEPLPQDRAGKIENWYQ